MPLLAPRPVRSPVRSPRRSPRRARPVSRAAVVGPAWFTPVMGTGAVALALDVRPLWDAAAALLVGLVVLTAGHARTFLDHPVQRHFLGAAAMAPMVVGAGAPGVPLAALLWSAGTALGVWTAVVVPRRSAGTPLADVGPWWLLPVVPPVVSAATGAALVPQLPDGGRLPALLLCHALLVLGVLGAGRVLVVLARRILRHGFGPAAIAPAWLVVLGPLGQSVTAGHHLGERSGLPWLATLTACVGAPVVGAALVWLAVVAVVVVRARPPFTLAWWSATFPVATVVTGAAALGWAPVAGVLLVVLVAGWVVAAGGTLRGLRDGSLLRG
ncbi:C4-dicarboxylate ABC transporter [Nocardioides dongxiaopingii]|uniref:SLAC1 family transporter n=1 Tax=Nocardioides dongxiaopingii TaxID=2576036 RepID=UPI0010C77033|nr:C4-dicarboxylate ABC transporter [Nocardioides dongxiaopingii]